MRSVSIITLALVSIGCSDFVSANIVLDLKPTSITSDQVLFTLESLLDLVESNHPEVRRKMRGVGFSLKVVDSIEDHCSGLHLNGCMIVPSSSIYILKKPDECAMMLTMAHELIHLVNVVLDLPQEHLPPYFMTGDYTTPGEYTSLEYQIEGVVVNSLCKFN